MNADFSRVLTLLRKERGISQKKASTDLGVSQGLLSHYEKGKRECGLDFLVKVANYYDVSCDYLLGRSPEPQGKTITVDEIPDEELKKDKSLNGSVMVTFNKKLIVNSLNVLFAFLQKSKSKALIKEVSSYLMLSIYQMFRVIFSSNKKNDENFFTVPKTVSEGMSNAAMQMSYACAKATADGIKFKDNDTVEDSEELSITTAGLSEEFAGQYSSMVNLIKNSEAKINILTNAEK